MTLNDQVRKNPMNWKDWINAVGLILTLGTVVLQGGRMIERQDAANAKLAELTAQINQISRDMASAQRDIESLRGRDALHDEQIRSLRESNGRK